jgi:DNA-binding response OmpR family regulator
MLPKVDGLSLCRSLRQEKYSVPILMLTAKAEVEDKVEGLDSGADDYLTKPFAFEELLARIRVLLRKKIAQPATRLRVADLELDLLSHKVRRAHKEIALTTKEFLLLEYLMRNAACVVTRTMISEHVWDIHFDTESNVIDVHINYLRRKIDEDFPKKLIRTIRGRGYMLKG